MNLKEAKQIARSVGATIEEKKQGYSVTERDKGQIVGQTWLPKYIIRLGVKKVEPNGAISEIKLETGSLDEAAHLAVIETGRAALDLVAMAKRVYANSDLLFGMRKS